MSDDTQMACAHWERGCRNEADGSKPLCWPCWASERDHGSCQLHEKPLAQRFSDLELSYELRAHIQEMYGPREPWWGPLGEVH